MARKRIAAAVEHQLLMACQRKCCLCYFLDGDKRTRKGQIAHINQDRSDPRLENLVWLCFEHHDEYDSTTRQSKGLTAAELRAYRDRLAAVLSSQAHDSGRHEAGSKAEVSADGAQAVRAGQATERAWRFPMWQIADLPELFAYSAPSADGICAIERIDLPDGRVVIACSQVPGNPGTSITNGAEHIFRQVCSRFDLPVHRIVWLQHYDHPAPAEWRLVAFVGEEQGELLETPRWTRMTPPLWTDLGLSPRDDQDSSRPNELRSMIAKHFPWPPADDALGVD